MHTLKAAKEYYYSSYTYIQCNYTNEMCSKAMEKDTTKQIMLLKPGKPPKKLPCSDQYHFSLSC